MYTIHSIFQMYPRDLRTGYLGLILGPMFSGKSSMLMRQLVTLVDLGQPCCYVNSKEDTRTTTCVSTHGSQPLESPKITYLKTSSLALVDVSGFSVIGVDEGQFFEDLVPIINEWVMSKKVVFVAGLSGDSFKRPFGSLHILAPQADDVMYLKAKCVTCLESGALVDAAFTKRLVVGTETKLIGGGDKYAPVCRLHHC